MSNDSQPPCPRCSGHVEAIAAVITEGLMAQEPEAGSVAGYIQAIDAGLRAARSALLEVEQHVNDASRHAILEDLDAALSDCILACVRGGMVNHRLLETIQSCARALSAKSPQSRK